MNQETCNCEFCDLKSLFFEHLEDQDVESFCNGKVEKEYKKGDVIVKEGSLIQDFVYLKSGLVKLFHTDNHKKEQIISIALPFDYISLLSVFSNQRFNYSVTAIEDSVTCCLDMKNILNLVKSNGNYALGIIEKMSTITDKIILNNLDIRKKHLRGRVAYVLMFFHDEIYKSLEFELPLSRKEIGEYIGMTTENVIRTLSEFRKDKTISINGKVIVIRDLDTLKAIAQFG